LYNKVIYEGVLATDQVRLHLCTGSFEGPGQQFL
jgi:hypothetical protein